MKKRFLSIFLTICMLLSLLPTVALAADEGTTGEPAPAEEATYKVDVQYYGDDGGDGEPTQSAGGTVEGGGEYAVGASVTIKVTPDTANGYCTAQWTVLSENIEITNGSLTDNLKSHTFEMPDGDVSISITFRKHSYTGYTPSEDGQTHDVHCIYCKAVQTETEAHVDETGAGNDPSNGYCDKCSVRLPGIYIVRFDGNHESTEGRVYDEIVDVGNAIITLPVSGFTLEGHTFLGWSTDSAATQADYRPNDSYTVSTDTIFYAIWIENSHVHNHPTDWSSDKDKHWHECKCGDKTGEAEHTAGPAATATEPQTCTVCGYEIAPATGYTLTLNYSEDSTGVSVDPGSKTVTGIAPGTVVDLSAHWPANKTVTVGETTYYFAGFEQNKGDTKVESPTVTVNSDLTLNANWTTTPMVSLTFETNNGTMPYAKVREIMYRQVGNVNSIHIPVRSGHDFVGWSLEDDGTADSGDTLITADCTLYAVWQQYSPSYDDDYYDDPPPASIPVSVGGDYDAILRDGMIIVRGDDPISGTLDLGKTDAEAIRLPADAVKASTGEGNAVTIKYPGGTSALITGSGLVAAGDALRSGENLQIAVRPVDAGALPEELTTPPEDDGPFGGIEAEIHTSVFSAAGIENIEDRLNTLGLINGNTDTAITEEEFEYLYHYLTTDELMTLRNKLNESAHFEHHQKAVDWLDEMIERDGIQVELNTGHLDESGIRSKLEAVGYTGSGLPLGLLRQADLDMKQLEYIKNLMQEYIEVLDDDADELVLAWAKEAIAQKELEASYAQMDSLIEEARSTNGSYTGLNDVKDAAKDMTTDELERFLAKASAAKSSDSGTLPVLALGALDKIIEYLNSELEARQAQEDAQDAPTYINVGGERAVFVGAIEADVKAVRASGSTRNIEILADRSNAVAWSTNIDPASLEELIAMLGNAAANDVASNIKAYKVLENGGLEAKAAKVTLNADGTLTASALSNGNSTYIFVLEPNPYADVDENDWYYDAAMTMDQRLLMQGTSATTFGGGVTTSRGMIATILYRLDGEPDADLESIFTDVAAGSYYHDAILWAEENGIVTGYGGGVFGPDDPITREQLAAMLYRYARYKGYDVSVGEDTNILSYNDAFEISEYAIPAMQWACGEGIITGKGGGILDPKGKATRAEAAVMLTRFLETEE